MNTLRDHFTNQRILELEAQRDQFRNDFERVSRVLANEVAMRKCAEASRDVAQEQVRELEQSLKLCRTFGP
jgi:hypothetical protein